MKFDLLYNTRLTDKDVSAAHCARDDVVHQSLDIDPVFPADIGKFSRQNSNLVRDLDFVSEKKALQKIALTPPPLEET